MKDTEKAQQALKDSFLKFRKDHEASFDELAQQVGYALDAVKYLPVPTDKEAQQASKPAEHVAPEPHHATAHHKK